MRIGQIPQSYRANTQSRVLLLEIDRPSLVNHTVACDIIGKECTILPLKPVLTNRKCCDNDSHQITIKIPKVQNDSYQRRQKMINIYDGSYCHGGLVLEYQISDVWRESKRPVAGNERVVVFRSRKRMGFKLIPGTSTIESVTTGGVAHRAGVRPEWNIIAICGESLQSNEADTKLRDAKKRNTFINIHFSIPSTFAMLYKVKKFITKSVRSFSAKVCNHFLSRETDQVLLLLSNRQIVGQILLHGRSNLLWGVDGNVELKLCGDMFALIVKSRILAHSKKPTSILNFSRSQFMMPIYEEVMSKTEDQQISKREYDLRSDANINLYNQKMAQSVR